MSPVPVTGHTQLMSYSVSIVVKGLHCKEKREGEREGGKSEREREEVRVRDEIPYMRVREK